MPNLATFPSEGNALFVFTDNKTSSIIMAAAAAAEAKLSLMKRLSAARASTKLVARNTVVDTVADVITPGVANVSSADREVHGAAPSSS